MRHVGGIRCNTYTYTAQQAKRPSGDLKVVVMSATLEAAKFVTYLPGAKAAMVHGRTFPVSLFYLAQVRACFGLCLDCMRSVCRQPRMPGVALWALHNQLPPAQAASVCYR